MFAVPTEYVTPCKNNGNCRRLMFEDMGLKWGDYPSHGWFRLDAISEKHKIPQYIGKYKCCTQCHLPINLAEAARANKLLGFTLEELKPDDEFMELLNGF